jgi:hypothetical protein
LIAVAVLGDFAAFMLFAGLGRNQHGASRGAGETLITGLPFFVAWLLVAAAAGMYRHTGPAKVARRTLMTWLLAWPFALLMRAGIQHRGIPLSFDLVALIANGIFLTGWRLTLQTVTRLKPR